MTILSYLKKDFSHQKVSNILEIGCGFNSPLKSSLYKKQQIITVDHLNIEQWSSNHLHIAEDFLNISIDIKFDLIIDRLTCTNNLLVIDYLI